jgi:type VI secretion system secreted protein VgrG
MEHKVVFSFFIEEIDAVLEVLEIEGLESISEPFIYKIHFQSEDEMLNLPKAVKQAAQLTLDLNGNYQRNITGYIKSINQEGQSSDRSLYNVELVPQISFSQYQYGNQIFLDKKFKEILPDLMEQMGLISSEYELKLNRDYKQFEFITQYDESTLFFMQRWMAREGIYYYFDTEKNYKTVVITDSKSVHKNILYEESLEYRQKKGSPSLGKQIVWNLKINCNQVPRSVLLRDYNFHKSSMLMEYKKVIDVDGKGDIYIYGENFEDEDEAEILAKIRAESELCREMILKGFSNNPAFTPGYKFNLKNHYRPEINREYLIIKTRVEGINADQIAQDKSATKSGTKMNYRVEFDAIPSDVQYRSRKEKTTARVSGVISAKIDAAGNGQYAEIDKEGRYNIILPYDRSGRKDGKASCAVRKSESYLGDDYGIHFPLHKNSEVLISFVDGNPDRPMIIGAVHNSENKNPVVDENSTESRIKTAGGNEIVIDDEQDKELISIFGKKNAKIEISNDRDVKVKHDDLEEIGNNQKLKVINDQSISIGNDISIEIGNNMAEIITSDYSTETQKNKKEKIGADSKLEIKGKLDEIIEKDHNQKNNSNYIIDTNKKHMITAGDKFQIKCGSSEIIMEKSGKIMIKGSNITIKASGTLTLKGAKIGEN